MNKHLFFTLAALLILPTCLIDLHASQWQLVPMPTPYVPPQATQQLSTWQSIKSHISDYPYHYMIGGMAAIIGGMILYDTIKTRKARALQAKEQKKKNKEHLDLTTFPDKKFLKILEKFVTATNLHLEQERSIMILRCIDTIGLTEPEKESLKTRLEKFSWGDTEVELYQENVTTLLGIMKAYLALDTNLYNSRSYTHLVETRKGLTSKGIDQLTQRMAAWGKNHECFEQGNKLLTTMTRLSSELEKLTGILLTIQLQELYEHKAHLYQEERIIAQKIQNNETCDQQVVHRVNQFGSEFPYVAYEQFLGSFIDAALAMAKDAPEIDKVCNTLAINGREQCNLLAQELILVRNYVHQQPDYKGQLHKHEKRQRAEKQEAERRKALELIEGKIGALSAKVDQLASSVNSMNSMVYIPTYRYF